MGKQQKLAKKAHKRARRASRWMMKHEKDSGTTTPNTQGGTCYTPAPMAKRELIPSTPVDEHMFSQMAQVYVGETMLPTEQLRSRPLTLILTPAGVCEVRSYRHMHLVRATGTADRQLVLHDQLPAEHYFRIVGLFKAINAKYSAEALVYIWRHDQGTFALTVPEQRVSGGSADPTNRGAAYEPPAPLDGVDGTWHLWGHIHSHNTMSAFFSGVDDASEQEDGLVYGVVGHIGRDVPEVKFRARTMGAWIELDPSVVIARGAGTVRVKPSGLDYFITVPYSLATATVEYPAPPEEWVDRIKGHRTTYAVSAGPMQQAWQGSRGWVGGRSVPVNDVSPAFPRVIRRNGQVDILWRNGDVTFSGKSVSDLTTKQRKEALMEGVDWFAPVGANAPAVTTLEAADPNDDTLSVN